MLNFNDKFYTTGQIARILNCSRVTVFHWIHSGKISAIKTVGGHYRIPKDKIEKILKSASTAIKGKKRKTKILVVDDDHHIVKTLVLFLQKISPLYDVYGTTDSFDAGRLMVTFKPDIAIIDIVMPGMDGFEIVEKIKSDPLTKHTKIIAITGYGTKENIEKIKQKGASICVMKPFDYYEIANIIKKLTSEAK
ncbi:MAG TPA: response regulator [bacterium]|nr:response regulator [bacterium]HOL35126.1 response regulator [bacterium]HPP07817.1 response regulator [bacterium]